MASIIKPGYYDSPVPSDDKWQYLVHEDGSMTLVNPAGKEIEVAAGSKSPAAQAVREAIFQGQLVRHGSEDASPLIQARKASQRSEQDTRAEAAKEFAAETKQKQEPEPTSFAKTATDLASRVKEKISSMAPAEEAAPVPNPIYKGTKMGGIVERAAEARSGDGSGMGDMVDEELAARGGGDKAKQVIADAVKKAMQAQLSRSQEPSEADMDAAEKKDEEDEDGGAAPAKKLKYKPGGGLPEQEIVALPGRR